MKAQEPWIGKRGRIGVIIPSTNSGVEYDCQRISPEGVTWHFARFFVSQPDLSSDDMFLAFIEAIRGIRLRGQQGRGPEMRQRDLDRPYAPA